MASEIVVLTDSDDDVHFCGISPGKRNVLHEALNSDDELMNLDLDSPPRNNENKDEDFDFEILETEVRTSLAERLGYETYTTRLVSSETQNGNIPKVNCPITEPVNNHNQPAKKTTKTKEDKAFDKAYDKACKAAEAANKKFNRSSECLKSLTALIDSRLLDSISSSGSILTQLQESEMKHSIVVSSVSNSVCWKREKVNHHVNEDAKVCSTSTFVEEDEGLVVMLAQEFVLLAQSSICDSVNTILRNLKKKKLTLVVYGLSAYHKDQSRKEKRRFREHVSATTENTNKSNKKVDVPMNENVVFTSADMESLKVKLLLQTDCSLWPVETAEELGKIIARITKAVAERPFKEERLEQTFDFYAADVSGNIKVSKDGHGLERLWQQQLMQFPLVALETSQAIASRYPSPQSLIQ
ncbi:hypothetical protein DAPPUDRAFT_95947, partial [Daphnia pulex]